MELYIKIYRIPYSTLSDYNSLIKSEFKTQLTTKVKTPIIVLKANDLLRLDINYSFIDEERCSISLSFLDKIKYMPQIGDYTAVYNGEELIFFGVITDFSYSIQTISILSISWYDYLKTVTLNVPQEIFSNPIDIIERKIKMQDFEFYSFKQMQKVIRSYISYFYIMPIILNNKRIEEINGQIKEKTETIDFQKIILEATHKSLETNSRSNYGIKVDELMVDIPFNALGEMGFNFSNILSLFKSPDTIIYFYPNRPYIKYDKHPFYYGYDLINIHKYKNTDVILKLEPTDIINYTLNSSFSNFTNIALFNLESAIKPIITTSEAAVVLQLKDRYRNPYTLNAIMRTGFAKKTISIKNGFVKEKEITSSSIPNSTTRRLQNIVKMEAKLTYGWSGTFSINPTKAIEIIRDIVRSDIEHSIVFVTGEKKVNKVSKGHWVALGLFNSLKLSFTNTVTAEITLQPLFTDFYHSYLFQDIENALKTNKKYNISPTEV